MKVLIDTNVILDVLCNRPGFVENSKTVWKMCETGLVTGYISALSLPNIMYILRKEVDAQKAKNIVMLLSGIFEIADMSAKDVKNAACLQFDDYEDAVQSCTASRLNADYIVTRNTKDFEKSPVKAVTPSEFLANANL